jgi:hypothetical protein
MATKPSKNNPDNKKMSQRNVLVTSSVCENCKEQCTRGKNYLIKMSKTHSGKGCVCEKLKNG